MFILVEVVFAIIFVSTSFDGEQNVAGVFEWIVALVFTFYVLTFFMDLLPAARSAQEHTNIENMHKQEMDNGGTMMNGGGNGYNGVNGRHTPTTNF